MGKKTGKRYTEEQIIRILDELKKGRSAEEVCRTYGVAQSTLYRWKNQYTSIKLGTPSQTARSIRVVCRGKGSSAS